ncbi:1-aminocyclopropane-1-carboxylate deaminase [Rhodobacterales bacterium 52_120_T64]|nr:1-aminocyclopropane-1-carboxylate deaminase [Rhodobacterales bacterium 52_120_T64]
MRSSRRSDVAPFIVMDVMEAARVEEEAGRDIIHMEVGQPATGAPSDAVEALKVAMDDGALGYTVALGLPELRVRIAQLYMDWYGVKVSPERVVVTAGSSAAFQLAFISLFDAGDRVAIGDPGYPSYRNILKALDIDVASIETGLEARFQPTVKELQAEDDLAGLLVASPSNPTGTMLDRDALQALISYCESQGIAFISDEIYHGIEYGKKAVTALEISDDVYVINSFSKYFSMTGWRIGWMIVPEDHVRGLERLMQNLFICAPHASQIAALAALDSVGELEDKLAIYERNRALLLEELPKVGFDKIAPPDGAFYIYADVSDLTDDSVTLARQILLEAGVAVTPGVDFDPLRGHKTLRFSYARSTEDIVEGVRRLKTWMDSKKAP